MVVPEDHRAHAEAVRAALTGTDGSTPPWLRAAVLERAGAGTATVEPYDSLARTIAEDASRVTDAQVAAVRAATGSQKGAFEVIMAASIGAGLKRWDTAIRAIEETDDATT